MSISLVEGLSNDRLFMDLFLKRLKRTGDHGELTPEDSSKVLAFISTLKNNKCNRPPEKRLQTFLNACLEEHSLHQLNSHLNFNGQENAHKYLQAYGAGDDLADFTCIINNTQIEVKMF